MEGLRNTVVYFPEFICFSSREVLKVGLPTCHFYKENKSFPRVRHSCACAMQSPFKPEVTSSNSWKRAVFLRT